MTGDLVPAFGVPGVAFTPTGIRIVGDISYGQYEQIGAALGALRDMTAWGLGDWLAYGEQRFPEKFSQAAEATGRSPVTLQEYMRVARRFAPERRRPGLSFTHHQLVAARPVEEQEELLDQAEANGWSSPELHGAITPLALLPRHQLEDICADLIANAIPSDDGTTAYVPVELLDQLRDALGAVVTTRKQPVGTGVERVALTVPVEAAAALGVSPNTFDRHVRDDVRLIRIGDCVLVPVDELRRWAREKAAFTLDPGGRR